MFHHFHPLWVRHCDLVRHPFSMPLTKRPRTFLILKRSSQVSKGIHARRGRFQACKDSYLGNDPHDGDDLFGWWRIHNERVLKINGVPLEDFRGLSEDHFRFVSRTDAGQGSL